MPNRFARSSKGVPSIGRQKRDERKAKQSIRDAVEANGKAQLSSQEKLQQEISEEDNKDLKTYKSHGVHFHESKDGESKALCPFCQDNAFTVNEGKGLGEDGKPSTKGGMFKCWSCGKSGNKYTFLQLYYDQCYDETSLAHYKILAKQRSLPVEAFKMAEWAYDKTLKRWLIPTRNRKGSMVNLPYWVPDTNIIYNTGGCAAHLYNLERLDDSHTIFICEGQHDVVALEYFLYQAKAKDYSIVGVPGADTFKPEWAEHFADKKVFLAYDNDERGVAGQKKACDILRKHTRCRELHSITWPDSYPEKFDIRDYVIRSLGKNIKGNSELLQMFDMLPLHDEKSCGVVREKFTDVVKDFKKHIHFNQDMENGLALAFAVVLSNVILDDPYCPIWTFLVGPPGCLSGNTEVLINRGGKTFPIRLDHLYHKFHGGESNHRKWNENIPTTIQYRSEEDGCIRLCELRDVVDSGKKVVYLVTLNDGRQIEATKDHRFFGEAGWERLEDLNVGDRVYVNTGQGKNAKKRKKPCYQYIQGLHYHPNKRKAIHCVLRHRLVIEAAMNGVSLDEFIGILRNAPTTAARFKYLDPAKPVHHKDENPFNNDLDNLEVCDDSKEHNGKHKFAHHVLYQTGLVGIQSIKKIGKKHTYDICVDHPHNFIANGFVVHNSGKTLIIETVSDNDLVVPLDKMTANSLVSMYKTPDGSDPSLLPKVIGKTLAMKDWTVVMRLPSGDQEIIHGTMRAAFDGRFGGASGIGNGRVYPEPGSGHETCHFTFISGVTDDIYLQNRTAVGERTLKFKIFRGNTGILQHIQSAAKNTLEGTVPELILREFANAFIEHKKLTHTKTPAMPKDIEERLIAASQISCITSAIVHRKQGELLRRPSPTVATRMMKQLIHTAQSLAFVFDLDAVDERCYGICKQMALDTCDGWHADILLALSSFPKGALRDEIMLKTKDMDRPVKSATIQRCLEDLFELAAVSYETVGKDAEKSERRGQPARKWFLTPMMQELFDQAKINEKPKRKVQALPLARRSTKKKVAKKKPANRTPRKTVKKKARRR